MKRLGTTSRIAFAMAMWSAVVLFGLRLAGVLDDGTQQVIGERTRLCETIAVCCSQFASRHDTAGIHVTLSSLLQRHPEVLSAACRPSQGDDLVTAGDHARYWSEDERGATTNRIAVTVMSGPTPWGQVELAFVPPVRSGVLGWLTSPSIRLIGSAVFLNVLGFAYTLRRCFRQMDPAQAVPERVRTALDTLAESVLVLDARRQIMLANDAFARLFESSTDEFQGQTIESLPWKLASHQTLDGFLAELLLPKHADAQSTPVQLNIRGTVRTFKASASPIEDQTGVARGTLLSLDDITILAQRTHELQVALSDLEASRAEIEEQNQQLRYLATRDPLTGCLNRRAFFEQTAEHWRRAAVSGGTLTCIMVDVDHFKGINDEHGHATGDEVLKRVAQTLLSTAGERDLVCRFGGEEFCLLLVDYTDHEVLAHAELVRQAVSALVFDELKVTASFGCASTSTGETQIDALLELADQALYTAKRSGRNRVVAAPSAGVVATR